MPNEQQDVLYFQPVNRGLANPDGSQPIRYYGKVYRVPKSEHGTIRQLEWETTPRELIHNITGGEAPSRRCAQRNITERFEVIDPDSGDIWVMYRVPCDTSHGNTPNPASNKPAEDQP